MYYGRNNAFTSSLILLHSLKSVFAFELISIVAGSIIIKICEVIKMKESEVKKMNEDLMEAKGGESAVCVHCFKRWKGN